MIYAVIENDNVVKYPLDDRGVRSLFPTISFPMSEPVPQLYMDQANVVKIEEVPKPADETKIHELALLPVKVNGVWKQKWNTRFATPEELSVLIEKLVSELELYAKFKEDGGLAVGEITIASNPETQHKLTAASIKAKEALAANAEFAPIHWKGVGGWFTLDASTIIMLSEVLFKYVEFVFTTRFELDTAIRAGTVTTKAQIYESFDALLQDKVGAYFQTLGLNN